MKIKPGREPTSARTWGPGRIPAARDGQDASAEDGTLAKHDASPERDASAARDASAQRDASHAVAELCRLHYPALVRLAALLIPDLATAEDIVQDAFAALHGRWHVQPDADAALAYLRWSVVHRSRSVPPLRPAEGTGEPASGTGGPGSAVMSALRALSPRQREVVVLRYFADLSEAEIAAAIGMSMAAVRDHAAQAISSLQAELGE
ncbi:MAG TPA: SigE family RNA polymerase sigma factor [Streptosporangiaceae bacterium]